MAVRWCFRQVSSFLVAVIVVVFSVNDTLLGVDAFSTNAKNNRQAYLTFTTALSSYTTKRRRSQRHTSFPTSLALVPLDASPDWLSSISLSQLPSLLSSSAPFEFPSRTINNNNLVPLLLAKDVQSGEYLKDVLIVLILGGGLIPAAVSANVAMLDVLFGNKQAMHERNEQREQEALALGKTSLDPTVSQTQYRRYITSSGASGPTLPIAPLLFAPEPIPLVDVIAILGRIGGDVNRLVDWKNLPSTRIAAEGKDDGTASSSSLAMPMWLPRTAFKALVRQSSFVGWPVDSQGQPVGGEELRNTEWNRVAKPNVEISDAALDAVWDTWAWGSSFTTPDKMQATLNGYYSVGTASGSTGKSNAAVDRLDLNRFYTAAVQGRSVTGLAALVFLIVQVLAYGSLFIAPALRYFLNIDIGFGTLGDCDPDLCVHLWK